MSTCRYQRMTLYRLMYSMFISIETYRWRFVKLGIDIIFIELTSNCFMILQNKSYFKRRSTTTFDCEWAEKANRRNNSYSHDKSKTSAKWLWNQWRRPWTYISHQSRQRSHNVSWESNKQRSWLAVFSSTAGKVSHYIIQKISGFNVPLMI